MKNKFYPRRALALLPALALAVSITACSRNGEPTQPPETLPPTTAAPETAVPTQAVTLPPETAPDTIPETAPETTEAGIPGPFNEGLDELRLAMEPSAAIAGVFFLGHTDKQPDEDGYFFELQNQAALLEYPFILEIPLDRYAKNDGGEVYCIVPADPQAHVEICFWDTDTDTPGDVVYQRDAGDPVILQGNSSDILPNLAITIVDSYGNILEHYQPHISLRDGTVALPEDPVVLDFTGSEPSA